MTKHPFSIGFIEVPHPADIALSVTGKTIESLFIQSMMGMASIAEIKLTGPNSAVGQFSINEKSLESLLVSFLSELLYLLETGRWPEKLDLSINENHLDCSFSTKECSFNKTDIKAITYSEMKIIEEDGLFHTKIVFDV